MEKIKKGQLRHCPSFNDAIIEVIETYPLNSNFFRGKMVKPSSNYGSILVIGFEYSLFEIASWIPYRDPMDILLEELDKLEHGT